jgi:hypothetical protein
VDGRIPLDQPARAGEGAGERRRDRGRPGNAPPLAGQGGVEDGVSRVRVGQL